MPATIHSTHDNPSPLQDGLPSSSSTPPPPPNPLATAYENFVQQTPFVTQCLLSTVVVSYLLSWIVDYQYGLSNIPNFTLWEKNWEIYRLLTSPLVNTSFLSVFFAISGFASLKSTTTTNDDTELCRLEQNLGSTAFAWLCVVQSVLSNLIFYWTCILLYMLTDNEKWLFQSASGIWMILIGLLALDCIDMPLQKRRFLCFMVPTQYYPIMLYLLFALANDNLLLGYLISMGLGYGLGLVRRRSNTLAASSSTASNPLSLHHVEQFFFLNSAKVHEWEETTLAPWTQKQGWIKGQASVGSGGAWHRDEENPSGSSGTVRHSAFVFARC